MKSFHNNNFNSTSFQSSSGLEPSSHHHNHHHHDSSCLNSSSSTTSSSTTTNCCYMQQASTPPSPFNVLNCNPGSRSLFMNTNNNYSKSNSFLRCPDALSAPSLPSIQVQSPPFHHLPSSPSSPILYNKNSTGFFSNNNESDLTVQIIGTDQLEKRFVLYRVEVTLKERKWLVTRRFSEFHHLLEVVSND